MKKNVTDRGTALVITLILVVLLSGVIVSYVSTAGIERRSSLSHLSKVQADLLTKIAIDVAASRVTGATSVESGSGWWVSQPGRIAKTTIPSSSGTAVTTFVDLTSGEAGSITDNDLSVDLNPKALTQQEGLITSSTVESLRVKWVYVRQDGTQIFDPTQVPDYSGTTSPIIGRYAFWTDDETSRININTALSSTNSHAEVASHPSRIDFALLSSSAASATDSDKLRLARYQRLFGSVEDLKRVSSTTTVADTVRQHKSSLTNYNHSSDLNPFGDEKIVLTTQENLAGGRPYLKILAAGKENLDPGKIENLDGANIKVLVEKLYGYLNKPAKEWGLTWDDVPADAKYTVKYSPQGATQIILNIIDYVRSVESAQVAVLPVRGSVVTTATTMAFTYNDTNGYGPNGILGHSRRLHIVEMAVWLPPAALVSATSASSFYYDAKLKVRVHLPATAGGSANIVGTNILYTIAPISNDFSVASANFNVAASDVIDGNSLMAPGEYRTIERSVQINLTGAAVTSITRPTGASMRIALRGFENGKWLGYDLTPVYATSSQDNKYYFDAASVAEAKITSISTDDPAVSQSTADWKSEPGTTNTFGTQNLSLRSSIGKPASSTIPQQDTDTSGNITNVSASPPSIKGSAANPLGRVGGVGDLGLVHTGGKGTLAGTSWRSLRLQTRKSAAFSMPDWPLLELFSAPAQFVGLSEENKSVLFPAAKSIGGRINLNSKVYPFDSTQMNRTAPLVALFRSMKPSLTDTAAESLASALLNHAKAPLSAGSEGILFGPKTFTDSGLYTMPGEISEISVFGTSGEEGEDLVRKLVDHLTTKSNVYSVFAVGQKVQQLRDGKIKVLGESRTRTILERKDGKMHVLSTQELGL